ncbi:MAG: hypothetical protein JSU00_03030 [Acidobacteria bacterium]|nr:hypothetical protein [Acidobacteriota bacterium]
MLQQKLIVGRFIHFRFPTPPAGGHAQNPAVFITVPQNMMNIAESTGVFKKTSTTGAGAHATKPWRTFGWLPWLPGSISEVQMGGSDVLTGPMSGCDLVMYRRAGVTYAGHLGTDVGADAQNASVKATWNGFAVASGQANIIGGFNPFLGWVGAYPVANANDLGAPIFFGLYTTAGVFYTLVLFSQRQAAGSTAAHPSLRRIAGLQQIASKTYAQLCNL